MSLRLARSRALVAPLFLLLGCGSPSPGLVLEGALAGDDVCDAAAGEPFLIGLGFVTARDQPVTLKRATYTTDGNAAYSVFVTAGSVGGGPESAFPDTPHLPLEGARLEAHDTRGLELVLRASLIRAGRTELTKGRLTYHDGSGDHTVPLASHISLNTPRSCP